MYMYIMKFVLWPSRERDGRQGLILAKIYEGRHKKRVGLIGWLPKGVGARGGCAPPAVLGVANRRRQ